MASLVTLLIAWAASSTALAADPSPTCITPLAVVGRLEELRAGAASTTVHERALAKYFRPGAIFNEPLIQKLLLAQVAVLSKQREASRSWRLTSKTNSEIWNSLSEYHRKDSFKGFWYLRQLYTDMADFIVEEPFYVSRDSGSAEYPWALNVSGPTVTLQFLRQLKASFPDKMMEPVGETGEAAMARLKELRDIITPLGWTEEEYYRLAPIVRDFFADMEKSLDQRHALPRVISEFYPWLIKRPPLEEQVRHTEKLYDGQQKGLLDYGSSFWSRAGNLFSSKEARISKALEPNAQLRTKAREELAAVNLKIQEYAAKLAQHGLERGNDNENSVIVNPQLTLAAQTHVNDPPNAHAPSSNRFDAARREIVELDALIAAYFSPSGLFGLKKVVEQKGKLTTAEDYLTLIRKLLTPPPMGENKTGAYEAERMLKEWKSYLDSLGVTEVQYLTLLADLRQVEGDASLQDRLLHRIVPEWQSDYKELNSLRALAFAKVEAPKPLAALPGPVNSVGVATPPAPIPLGPSREAIAHYLDSVNLWSGEYDRVAQTAFQGHYVKLAQTAKAISAELGKALKKGKPIELAKIRDRLIPLVGEVARQADAELPKLARLHDEGLMIQHGVANHLTTLRDLIGQRRKAALAEVDTLPDWQQDAALRQLDRDEMRLQTLEKIKLGFDQTMVRSISTEKTVERMRTQIAELSLFLNGFIGDPKPIAPAQVELLRQLLDGYATLGRAP